MELKGNWRKGVLSIAFVSCALILYVACREKVKTQFLADDRQMAEQEIAKLHVRFNSKDFDAIYDHQSQVLKQSVSKEDFTAFLNSVMEKFGNFSSIIDKRVNIVMGKPVQFRAVYNSQFERGVLTEMFVFLKYSDELQLAHYTISMGPTKLPMMGIN